MLKKWFVCPIWPNIMDEFEPNLHNCNISLGVAKELIFFFFLGGGGGDIDLIFKVTGGHKCLNYTVVCMHHRWI